MRILPRQEKFFELFTEQARIILEASELLLQAAKAGNSPLAQAATRIQELEKAGDEVIHELFVRLNKTFITPLDPEDIHMLSSSLDDVLDGIEDSAYRMVAYRLEPITPQVVEFCEIIHKSSLAIQKALGALEEEQRILEHCIEINRLEGAADELLRRVVSELFEYEKDPIALIKQKEIYEFLEATTDRCEDVADVLQNVVVKNS